MKYIMFLVLIAGTQARALPTLEANMQNEIPSIVLGDYNSFSVGYEDYFGINRYGNGKAGLGLGNSYLGLHLENRGGVFLDHPNNFGMNLLVEPVSGQIDYTYDTLKYKWTPAIAYGPYIDLYVLKALIAPRLGLYYPSYDDPSYLVGAVLELQLFDFHASYYKDYLPKNQYTIEQYNVSIGSDYYLEKKVDRNDNVYSFGLRMGLDD